MKQLKIVLTVQDSEGNEKFRKDPAQPQDITAALGLFGDAGITISASIVEIEVNN